MKNSNLFRPIPFEIDEMRGSLNERLETVVEDLPDEHLAYHDPHLNISYAQLFKDGKRLAAALAASLGPAQNEQQMVALLLDADWTEILGLLGVVFSGHYYVAFDPLQGTAQAQPYFLEYPIRALLTSTRYADVARNLAQLARHEIKILLVDDIPEAPKEHKIPTLDADSYHSVYFTSGSTGKPRGVLRTHGVILHSAYISSVDLGFVPSDRITLTMPISLGMSLTSTLGALLNGVTICRRTEALAANPLAFYRWLQDDGISIARASAGLIRSLTNLPEKFGAIESLRLVDTGGEAFKRREIERVLAFLAPGGKLNIRLASNEAGNYAMFRVQAGQTWEGETNPAGFPPKFVDVLVVDENRQPLAVGQKGELAVRSRFLSAGYINDPVQTAERFEIVPDGSGDRLYFTGDLGRILPDGSLEFLGRRDFRVKVRGYTIELEAVEKALKNLPNVRDAAAMVQALPNGNKRLAGFLVFGDECEFHLEQVRKQLAETLPSYMVPSILQAIEAIPLTPTGKPDRKALPQPTSQRPALAAPYRAPQTDSELELVRIWESILGIQPLGIDDSFFELGGDSLMSMQMVMEVEKYFNVAVPSQFFRSPTIAYLAQLLQTATDLNQSDWQLAEYSKIEKRKPEFGMPRKAWHVANFTHGQITTGRILNAAAFHLRRLLEQGMLTKSYEHGLNWLMDWVNQPLTRNMLYAREKEIFYAFFSDVKRTQQKVEESFLIALAANILASRSPGPKRTDDEKGRLNRYVNSPYLFWRTFSSIIAQPESHFAQKFLTVSGLENLQAAYERRQGMIVLAYHGTMVRLPSLLMPYLLGKPAALVLSPRVSMREDSGLGRQLQPEEASLQGVRQARYGSDIMVQGYRALRAGEVVVAFVDNGFTSRGDWPLAVCGRQYLTRAGWADLASRTGASVVPVISTLLPECRSSVRFLKPFSSLDVHVDHETRVQNYMNQFAEYLTLAFTNHPESLRWKIMQNHLEISHIDELTRELDQ